MDLIRCLKELEKPQRRSKWAIKLHWKRLLSSSFKMWNWRKINGQNGDSVRAFWDLLIKLKLCFNFVNIIAFIRQEGLKTLHQVSKKILWLSSFVGVIFFWMSSENREANFIKLDRPSSQKPEKNPSFFGGGANPKMSWRGRTTLVTNFKTFYRCRFSKALKLEVIFVTKDLIRFSTLEKVRIWRDPIMYSRGCQHFKLVSRKFALDHHLQNQLKINKYLSRFLLNVIFLRNQKRQGQ